MTGASVQRAGVQVKAGTAVRLSISGGFETSSVIGCPGTISPASAVIVLGLHHLPTAVWDDSRTVKVTGNGDTFRSVSSPPSVALSLPLTGVS